MLGSDFLIDDYLPSTSILFIVATPFLLPRLIVIVKRSPNASQQDQLLG